jgi:hypothetical protein
LWKSAVVRCCLKKDVLILTFHVSKQALSGPELVFSDTLPASAVNLGLGANAFPGETNQQLDLINVVAQNITLFLEETFGDAQASAGLQQSLQAVLCVKLAICCPDDIGNMITGLTLL